MVCETLQQLKRRSFSALGPSHLRGDFHQMVVYSIHNVCLKRALRQPHRFARYRLSAIRITESVEMALYSQSSGLQ